MRRAAIVLVLGVASCLDFKPVEFEAETVPPNGVTGPTMGTGEPSAPTGPTGPSGPSGPSGPTGPTGPAEPVLSVSSVSIGGAPARQVRQGDSSRTLSVTGTGFARLPAPSVSLAQGATTLAVGVSIINDTQMSIAVTVPHAALVGAYSLTITDAIAATVTTPQAVVVTHITAGPAGSDTTGRGTTEAPFRSMKAARDVASSGDTVALLAGIYDVANGETFATLTDTAIDTATGPSNLPAGITIVGAGRDLTELVGPGSSSPAAGFIIEASASLANLTVRDFRHDILIRAGTVTLQNVRVRNATNASSVAQYSAGLHVSGSAVVNGSGVYADGNTHGVFLTGSSNTTLTNATLTANASAPFQCNDGSRGVFMTGGSKLVMSGGVISNNRDGGIKMSSSGELSLTGVDLDSNVPYGSNCTAQVLASTASARLGPITFDDVDLHDGGQLLLNVSSFSGPNVPVVIRNSRLRRGDANAVSIGDNIAISFRNTELSMGPDSGNDVVAILGNASTMDFGTVGQAGGNLVIFDRTARASTAPGGHGIITDLRSCASGSPATTYRNTTIQMVNTSPAATTTVLTSGSRTAIETMCDRVNDTTFTCTPPGNAGCPCPPSGGAYKVYSISIADPDCVHTFLP